MLRVLIVAAAAVSVDGHASMVKPVPRNAADRSLPIFADGRWPKSMGGSGNAGCSCTGPDGGWESDGLEEFMYKQVEINKWNRRVTGRPRQHEHPMPPVGYGPY